MKDGFDFFGMLPFDAYYLWYLIPISFAIVGITFYSDYQLGPWMREFKKAERIFGWRKIDSREVLIAYIVYVFSAISAIISHYMIAVVYS